MNGKTLARIEELKECENRIRAIRQDLEKDERNELFVKVLKVERKK